jgi:hypothetical protein
MLFAGSMLLAAAPLAAQSKVFEKTVGMSPGGILRLNADRGSVRLTGWERNEVEVRARIEADRSLDSGSARRAVDGTTVDVITIGADVAIRGNYENVPREMWLFGDFQTKPNIHYEIRAPRRADLRLEIDRADSTITGFEGRLDLQADRSVIDARDLTGPMRITLDRAGDSSFRNIRGSFNIEADRTNVRVDVAQLQAPSAIEIDRGDIDMSMSRAQGFDLDARLTRRATPDTSLPVQTRSFQRENPSGPVNGGGPRLAIDADRSRIRLR